MVQFTWKNHGKYAIAALVALFALFAFWVRIIPLYTVGHTDILQMVAMDDPMYNLRQVEVMLAQHGYAWFDAMTTYPTGTTIYWGPLFTTLVSLFCILTGATTRPEIIASSLLVTPLIAAATVVVMYGAGKVSGDWKTGLIAAGFTAVMGGQFLVYSIYGYIDHHIAEVLFSTIFCVAYCYTLASARDRTMDLRDFSSWRQTFVLALLCGAAYLLGLFVMPTMILFAMIAGIFTVIQSVLDFSRGRPGDYLLVINGTTFLVAMAGLLLFGLKSPGADLSTYSIGHVYAYAGLIGGTVLLWYLARILRGKPWYYYPGILAGAGVLIAIVLYIVSQPLYTLFVYDLYAFFGQAPASNTVEEAMGWSVAHAWDSFTYSLLLLAGGILVLLYRNIRDEHPHHVFVLVWALVMLLATWQHIRYEYYLAVCIALVSAICVGFFIDLVLPALSGATGGSPGPGKTDGKGPDERGPRSRKKMAREARRKTTSSSADMFPKAALAVIVIGLAVIFVSVSASDTYGKMSSISTQMIDDWRESMEWMGNNTPETGMDYLAISDPGTFRYPAGSYGVMSWWDYGHMITYIAKRIPNANPFQQGVAGPDGAAAYFVATDEDAANRILDHDGTRYVVTDILMDDITTGKFHAMATWYNSTAGLSPFSTMFYAPAGSGSGYQTAMLLRQDYYLSMVSRLHNFDGSMTGPSKVYYAEYADPGLSGMDYPVLTGGLQTNGTEAERMAALYNANASAGMHAGVFGTGIMNPAGTVPALRHYRLVHESPTNVYNSAAVDVKFVKVFEYVKGAHIRGSGTISLPVVTDTGRHFVYRQESAGGEFIVPYSTTGNPYGVKAEGKYTIEGTGQTFDVPESAVMQGTAIN